MQRSFLTRPTIRQLAMVTTLMFACVIVWASLIPSADLPRVGGSDKIKHFVAYFGLTAPILIWFGRGRWILVLVVVLACGASVEFAQALGRAGRRAEMLDMVANTFGALTGIVMTFIVLEVDRQLARLRRA